MISVAPETSYEATLEAGVTGLVGTLKLGTYDGDTATQALSTSDINEIGTTGVYVATRTSPDTRGQYVLVWTLDGTLDPDQITTEDLRVTSSTGEPFDGDVYGTTAELFRILKIRTPSSDQTDAAERVLAVATGEINAEIDLVDGDVLSGWQISLATEVALERAVEHWRQQESPFGIIGLGAELGATSTARDSWERHALKLAPLKAQWGLA